MRRVATGVAAALIGVLASANVARAQGTEFSLGGGVDMPLGIFNDGFKTGFHGLAGVSFHPTSLAGWHSGRRYLQPVQRRCLRSTSRNS